MGYLISSGQTDVLNYGGSEVGVGQQMTLVLTLVLPGLCLCHGVSYCTVSTPSGPDFGAYIFVATKNLLLHFLHHLGRH